MSDARGKNDGALDALERAGNRTHEAQLQQKDAISTPSSSPNPQKAPAAMSDEEKVDGSVRSTRPNMSLWREIAFILISCSTNIFTQANLAMTIAPINYIGDGLGVQDPGGRSWFTSR